MLAWVVDQQHRVPRGDRASSSLRRVERRVPEPGPDELLVRVLVCGVCRTDLHLAEGDLRQRRPQVVPGHEVVGEVVGLGSLRASEATTPRLGDLVGIAWLRSTCGECRWCRTGAENLCPDSSYTGWDVDGGYAEYAVVPAAFAYSLPAAYPPTQVAPLLCAGIIGYRALRRARLPRGGRLGIYGFGASAPITAQIAIAEGAEVHVLTRSAEARALALDLGAASATGPDSDPPARFDSAILFAPAGDLVPPALAALDRGGTLALAGIHLSDVPSLDYQRHLFGERTLTSVTSNTRRDGQELLALAERVPVRVSTTSYQFADADRALADLAAGRVRGAAVLEVAGG